MPVMYRSASSLAWLRLTCRAETPVRAEILA